jgi:hypothetical protein
MRVAQRLCQNPNRLCESYHKLDRTKKALLPFANILLLAARTVKDPTLLPRKADALAADPRRGQPARNRT